MTPAVPASVRLKNKLQGLSERHAEPSRIRIHRAISWLARAEQEADDPDAQFVFLWIAFNAAYAQEFGETDSTRAQLNAFFDKLLGLDEDKRLAALLFGQFTGPIRTMIGNKFVFEPFWKALREHDASDHWKVQFAGSGKVATRAVLDGRSNVVLSVVFDRLYVLRNQLIHGGATWASKVNRDQVRDGAAILLSVTPIVLDLMLDHPEVDFGEILYPVI